jgi:hypothetical protein
MKITTGTCYFPFFESAVRYYQQYNISSSQETLRLYVQSKIKDGEIKIGDPPLKENQEKKLIDNRWHICE